MTRKLWGLAGSSVAILLMAAISVADEPKDQPPPPESKSSGTFDSATQSIKKGFQQAGDALRGQYSKARTYVHDMGVSSRVYGRLHWDKALNGAQLEIDVQNDGVATLTGVVADARAKAKAVELTRDTVGITQVVDLLTIQPPPTTTPAPVTTPSTSSSTTTTTTKKTTTTPAPP